MKKNKLQYLFILHFFIACKFTAPLVQHTPTLVQMATPTQKANFGVGANYTTGKDAYSKINIINPVNYRQNINGLQLQGYYAITDKIALNATSNFSFEKNLNKNDSVSNRNFDTISSNTFNYNRKVTEVGVIFYKNILTKNLFGSIGIGAGLGKNKTNESLVTKNNTYTYNYNHNIIYPYIQPSLYYSDSLFMVHTAAKFSLVNFNNYTTNYTATDKTRRLLTTNSNLNSIMIDLNLGVAIFPRSLKGVGIQLQGSISINTNETFNSNYNLINAGIGIVYKK